MVHNPLSEMTVNDKAEFISQKHAAKKRERYWLEGTRYNRQRTPPS
jgi:hypothetical protein